MKLGILISGGGTTFLNLHKHIQEGSLNAEIACVISSSKKAKGLERAQEYGYATASFARRRFEDDKAYSEAIIAELKSHGAELVILAGFLKMFHPGEAYADRCLNIHPSLIPAFCGQGYYGMKVHEGVHARGCKISGCTIHLVNDQYDAGPIVLQRVVHLADGDTAEDIRAKVFEAECEAYPEAIKLFVDGHVLVKNDRTFITPEV